ncbi:class I SAM-dependent methyltransferase [Marinithermus hydrothermalis]|uniref:RNA cap guanine-n2 methyltransferase n=1 Tax=Marinithermus hydrothermalis (strain DSM 14884 / JCM 11576 / T1) TaxID=869210 RepID=F2NN14_MARHT|nr:class I SAM-dependent methyltransferase [Marinithermus hydrothermalis]AEB12753.1 RNA cap guanine-n2 methyltransferase [Marinithermus hydrothermalis DSM 14884]
MDRLTPERAAFLFTPEAHAALARLATADLSDAALLPRITELRRRFTAEQAALLLEQARLRRKARGKFPDAERLFFVAEALEQASSLEAARYRALSFAPFARVADLGAGIGADTLALAEVVREVIAVERDPLRALFLRANAAARGVAERVRVLEADWTQASLEVDAAFVDPARRREGRRVRGLEAMNPPFAAVLELVQRVRHVMVKLAPSVPHEARPRGAELEFISVGGECKEAVLRFGDLRLGASRVATVLPVGARLTSRDPLEAVPVGEPRAYLYEPDAAVIRAGLVQHLATRLGLAQLDPRIAYLTGEARHATPFARAWRVLRHGPFHLKTLNRWLAELEAGAVVLKKRGSPIDPDAFRRRLRTTPGGRPVTAFFTRVQDRPWMILAEAATLEV